MRSETMDPKTWMPVLKNFLKRQGPSPGHWEIYRGDAFQLKLPPAEALYKSMLLKSIIKQKAELDVRLSIGLGDVVYDSKRITESNGTAFVRSGRRFDSLKEEKATLALATGDERTDRTLNLLARFASLVMDNWSPSVAVIVQRYLENPEWNQEQIAAKLGINQSAVSQARKRAQLDLLMDFNRFYQTSITGLNG